MSSQIEEITETWVERDELPTPSASPYPRNDSDRAERFVKLFADELRYVHAWKRWLLWDGNRWTPDVAKLSLTISANAVGVGAAFQRLIATGERSRLQTHIATTARRLRVQLSGRMVWIDQTFLQKG